MPTLFTHPAIPLAARGVTGSRATSRRLLLVGVLGSVLPDVDAVGLRLGVPYGSWLGHRGFSHSLLFALLVAGAAVPLARWLGARRWWAFLFVFLSTVSHGILDACTDGGLGVAFFGPLSNQRFLFPWRPIPASPLALPEFFSSAGVSVLAAELALVWLPCLLVVGIVRATRRRAARATRIPAAVVAAILLVLASALAGAYAGRASTIEHGAPVARAAAATPEGEERAMLAEAVANLERQVATLAADPGPSCPQDFATLATRRPLRVSLFWGYDEHEGRVYDRADAGAMLHVLTTPCRGGLSACGFTLVARSPTAARLARTLGGRTVEVDLLTSSLAAGVRQRLDLLAAYREQDRLSRAVKERFYRELVASDVVFYMGHSRLGGGMGFDRQSGVTTLVGALSRRALVPVLAALRHRPTRLAVLGVFSCDSNRYFRAALQAANPSLALLLTTGEIDYGPAEQASLGALEAVLSQRCGHAFQRAMTAADDPDPRLTRRLRGR